MTYYGEGPINLVVRNKTRCDYASVQFCVRQKKRNNICVFIVKERNRQINLHLCKMNKSEGANKKCFINW